MPQTYAIGRESKLVTSGPECLAFTKHAIEKPHRLGPPRLGGQEYKVVWEVWLGQEPLQLPFLFYPGHTTLL